MAQPSNSSSSPARLEGHRFAFLLVVVAVVSAATHGTRVGAPQPWIGGDYAQYLMHAANVAEGRSFEDTPYVYNPGYPSLGPRAYPPGWPVLMAPVYAAFDGATIPIQVLSLVYFAGCLLLTGLLFRPHLPDAVALGGTAVIGLNPQLGPFAAGLGSDIPFLFFLLLGLLVLTADERGGGRGAPARSVLVGCLLFGAFAIRTVGGLLAPAMVLRDLALQRRVRRDTMVALSTFTVLVLLEGLWTSGSGSYLDQFNPTPAVLMSNALEYTRAFSSFWASGFEHVAVAEKARELFTLASLALIAVGYGARLRAGPASAELFVPLYVALILAWPAYQGLRFLIPLFPFAVLYLLLGAGRVASMAGLRPLSGMAAISIVPLIAYGTVGAFPAPAPALSYVDDAASSEFLAFLGTIPDEPVFIFDRPRILALRTGHRAAASHQPSSDEELRTFFDRIGATHLVLGPRELEGRAYLEAFIARNSESYRTVFANEVFQVFQILSTATTPASPPTPAGSSAPTAPAGRGSGA